MSLAGTKDSRCVTYAARQARYTARPEHAGWNGILRGGAKLMVKAWVVKQRRRLFETHAEIRIDGSDATLLAQADATMCLIGRRTPAEASCNRKESKSASV